MRFLQWQSGRHETKQVTCGDLVLTGVLHSKWSTFHSTSTHFFFHGAHKSLNKVPNICMLHNSIKSVALQCSSNSWQCPRICGWQHGRQHQTVLGSLSTLSCHGFVVQVPLLSVLAVVGLGFYGKHLETNRWCRIQWVWKYWSKYHLILMISPFTAPEIVTRLSGQPDLWRGCVETAGAPFSVPWSQMCS